MSEAELVTVRNVDLSNCDREQIQFPAATLSHGFLLALREPEMTIVQAGENAPHFLGGTLDQVLGQRMERWFNDLLIRQVLERMIQNPQDGPAIHVNRTSFGGREFDVFAHRCSGSLILEFELREEMAGGRTLDLYAKVHAGIARLQRESTLQAFLDTAVKQIREFTGFDRVMAYQFLEDGSGAVRAEAVAEGFDPFLGLHYPPSDIPLPARRLFKMTWLRHQPDIGYKPVQIVPAINPITGHSLDLSYALLRSVSVMYSQYLKNMGTQSSMVMTLLKNGELWGLIACHHHRAPRHVHFETRTACEFLAHMVSLLLSAKDEQEGYEYRAKLQTTMSHMVSTAAVTNDLTKALVDQRPGLLDFVDAGGAALVLHGKPVLAGATPEAEQVQALVNWLGARGEPDLFATDFLSAVYAEAGEYPAIASGLLAIPIGGGKDDYILWFRPEFQRTVNWAGNPLKPVDISDDGQRLFPRASFAIWKELVRSKSKPWKTVEIEAARELRSSLLELAVRQAEKLQALYRDLQRSHAELDAFAYIASHDLKEPLRGIHNYSQFVLEDESDTLSKDAVEKIRTVVRLTRRMDQLLDNLLHYARMGRQGLEIGACDLNKLLSETLDTLATRIQESGAEVKVHGPLPEVHADCTRVGEVLLNLISNALKYNDKERKVVEIGCERGKEGTVFFVRDNGIGIAPEHQESIFSIFRRLHPQDRFGGGAGAGLTIARKILERHEGRIWVESIPGEGSTFRFTIGVK